MQRLADATPYVAVSEQFDAICARYPRQIAAHDLRRKLTYAELADRVARVRAAVTGATKRNNPVGHLLPADVRSPAAALGILCAGRALVPLDPANPIERHRLIAASAGLKYVVTAQPFAREVARRFGPGVQAIDIDALDEAPARRAPAPKPDDLAWIIYTSGSTGAPKGVYQNHRGLMLDLMASIESFGLRDTDRQTWFFSMATIGGLRAALGCLLAGGELHVLPPAKLGPEAIAREVRRRRITVWRSSASMLRHVAAALKEGERFDDVRVGTFSGDYVHWADYDVFRKCCGGPNVRMICRLASTECATFLEWCVDERLRPNSPLLPMGTPYSDRTVTLIDAEGRAVPDGEAGEFLVASPTLALGYWRAPELTAQAFSADPKNRKVRRFRTGDLGRRRPDGLYEFIGRQDQQIKLAGQRIEIGEIEGVLRACSGVGNAAIVVRRGEDGAARALAAYVQLDDGVKGLLPRHVMAMLERRLPRHMLPAEIVVVDALPWLANFKVDRKRLDAMDRTRRVGGMPADGAALAVAEIFASVLKVSNVSADDSLATLGGDSLQAVSIVLALERRFGIALPRRVFDTSRSIAGLAAWIAKHGGTAGAAHEKAS